MYVANIFKDFAKCKWDLVLFINTYIPFYKLFKSDILLKSLLARQMNTAMLRMFVVIKRSLPRSENLLILMIISLALDGHIK